MIQCWNILENWSRLRTIKASSDQPTEIVAIRMFFATLQTRSFAMLIEFVDAFIVFAIAVVAVIAAICFFSLRRRDRR